MSVIDTLIFDRTQSDIANNTDKAYIDYRDLNRIEEAVRYISDLLNENLYHNTVNTKTNWNISELRKQAECDRIKQNYQVFKNAFAYKYDIPQFEWLSIEEANQIERILKELYIYIDKMIKSIRRVGTFYSGESEGLI